MEKGVPIAENAGAPGLFVRKATGLVRELNVFDVFLINIIQTNPIANFAVLFTLGLAVFPGSNIWLSTLTCVGVGCSLLVVYSLLAGAMPRSGGDYVFISRILHPIPGFVASWMMMFTAAFWAGYNAWAFPSWVLPDILGTLGQWTNNATLVNIATALPQTQWVVVVGIITLAVYFLIGLLGLRWIVRLQLISFALIILSLICLVPALLTADPSQFTSHFNSFAGYYHSSASGLLAAAHKGGYTGTGTFSWGATIGFWPLVMAVTGYAITSIPVSGEVRKAGRSQMIATLASNIISGIIMAGLFALVLLKAGSDLIGALGFFNFVSTTGSPFPFPLYGQIVAGIVTGSSWLTVLLAITVFLNMFSAGLTLQLWSTRYIFAWAFDRVLPAKVADIDERTHSPRNALILVAIISLAFALLLTFNPSFTFVSTGLLQTVLFLLVSLAGLILPWRMPELYKASIKRSILGIPFITIMAAISLLFNLVMAYFYLTNAAYGATNMYSWIFVLALLVSGLVYYFGAKFIQANKGVDLDLAYREIPPE
jgi:amino acid transporter